MRTKRAALSTTTQTGSKMKLQFAKMHGLGNDFIVLDGINQQINLDAIKISELANRHTGIGFDQCLIIEASTSEGIDFNYRIYNANGQEVGQCGNGARCLALFAQHYGLINKNTLTVATKTTQMHLRINDNQTVSVEMGVPKLIPADIPLLADQQAAEYTLELKEGKTAHLHALNVGNPHAVLVVNDLEQAPVATFGQEISMHPRFPEQTNTGFMRILNPEHIQVRVYERGCGETQACGSGAVAAAAVGRLFHHLSQTVTVSLLGGDLQVDWPNIEGPITLTGPGTFVYEGKIMS